MRPSFYATVNLVSLDHTDTEREPKAIPSSGHQRTSGALASPGIDAFPRASFYDKGLPLTRGEPLLSREGPLLSREGLPLMPRYTPCTGPQYKAPTQVLL